MKWNNRATNDMGNIYSDNKGEWRGRQTDRQIERGRWRGKRRQRGGARKVLGWALVIEINNGRREDRVTENDGSLRCVWSYRVGESTRFWGMNG